MDPKNTQNQGPLPSDPPNRYYHAPAPSPYIPPRIPITPSTIYAHTYMKGSGAQGHDCLHRSLFVGPHRVLPDCRIWVPGLSRERSIEELRKGTTLFWDPLFAPKEPLAEPKDPALNTQIQKRLYPLTLAYDGFVKENKPTVGANHYKGHQVYSNFGYIYVGGRWADPDSRGDVTNAYNGEPEEIRLPEICRDRAGGHRVMNPLELDRFYDEFTDDVSDNEGDPRSNRLSLVTFCQWAEGSVQGERYEEEVIQSALPLSEEIRNHKSQYKPPNRLDRKSQYDVETGSALSGLYDIDTDPSLLLSPLGVDIYRMPFDFAQNNPHAAARIKRSMYFAGLDGYQSEVSSSSTVSTPETFNSHRASRNIASIENLTVGIEEYNCIKNRIRELQKQADENADKANLQLEQLNHLGKVFADKAMEGFFLERRITEKPALDAVIASSLQTESQSEVPRGIIANRVTPRRKRANSAMNVSSAARLREFELSQLRDIEKEQTPTYKPKSVMPISSANRPKEFEPAQHKTVEETQAPTQVLKHKTMNVSFTSHLEEFELDHLDGFKKHQDLTRKSGRKSARSISYAVRQRELDLAQLKPVKKQKSPNLARLREFEFAQRKKIGNFSPFLRPRHPINTSFTARMKSLEQVHSKTIEKGQTPSGRLEQKSLINVSSAIRLRDLVLAQEPLDSFNMFSSEDMAFSPDYHDGEKAAAFPFPITLVLTNDALKDIQPPPAISNSRRSTTPAPDLGKRRIRSQYRRHLAELCEKEKIAIARAKFYCERYLQDQTKLQKEIDEKSRQVKENLEKLGVDKTPKGLIPTQKKPNPKVDLNQVARQQQMQREHGL